MAEIDPDLVCASLVRSPLHRGTWVPFLPDTEVYDSVWAGPLRLVKDAAMERAERADGTTVKRWRRDGDDWVLVAEPVKEDDRG